MIVAFLGGLIFWAGWAAWTGARLTLNGVTLQSRVAGAVLMVGGVAGFLYGMRLLAS